ncbi:MAG: polysaccharide deacetylase family protein [Clostridia bacterium]|nr:polysaccharide deacetylase family protein [Clostridia bacterium]
MKRARPRRGKKRFRIPPLLSVTVLVILVVGAVAIAAYLHRPTEEVLPSRGTSTSPQHMEITDTDTQTSSTLSEVDTDTDLPETTSSSEASVSDTDTDTTTDTGTASTDKEVVVTTIIPPPNDGTSKKIAFTFDDGPHFNFTRQIAEEFVKYGGKCTYFVVGNRVKGSNGEAMAYAASLGHEIGSHSYTHTANFKTCGTEVYDSELRQAHDAIQSAIGVAPTLMRPPGGNITKDRIAASQYSIIMWNVDPHDWQYKKVSEANVTTIVNNVLGHVTDGDIILMHDIYENTAEAVKILLPMLKDAGYEFVTVSELLGDYKAPGIRYHNAY